MCFGKNNEKSEARNWKTIEKADFRCIIKKRDEDIHVNDYDIMYIMFWSFYISRHILDNTRACSSSLVNV